MNEFSRGANENRSLEEQIQEMQRRWNLERKDYQVLTDEYSRELAAAKANLQQTNNELIRLAAEVFFLFVYLFSQLSFFRPSPTFFFVLDGKLSCD